MWGSNSQPQDHKSHALLTEPARRPWRTHLKLFVYHILLELSAHCGLIPDLQIDLSQLAPLVSGTSTIM